MVFSPQPHRVRGISLRQPTRGTQKIFEFYGFSTILWDLVLNWPKCFLPVLVWFLMAIFPVLGYKFLLLWFPAVGPTPGSRTPTPGNRAEIPGFAFRLSVCMVCSTFHCAYCYVAGYIFACMLLGTIHRK